MSTCTDRDSVCVFFGGRKQRIFLCRAGSEYGVFKSFTWNCDGTGKIYSNDGDSFSSGKYGKEEKNSGDDRNIVYMRAIVCRIVDFCNIAYRSA